VFTMFDTVALEQFVEVHEASLCRGRGKLDGFLELAGRARTHSSQKTNAPDSF